MPLTNIPIISDTNNPESTLPITPRIIISATGIQHQLLLLDTNKASGPDNIFPYILKNCANEIYHKSYSRSLCVPSFQNRIIEQIPTSITILVVNAVTTVLQSTLLKYNLHFN